MVSEGGLELEGRCSTSRVPKKTFYKRLPHDYIRTPRLGLRCNCSWGQGHMVLRSLLAAHPLRRQFCCLQSFSTLGQWPSGQSEGTEGQEGLDHLPQPTRSRHFLWPQFPSSLSLWLLHLVSVG